MGTPNVSRDYDFNLYAPRDGVLSLSAYRYKTDSTGHLATDTSAWVSLVLTEQEHREAVRWLMGLFFDDEHGTVEVDLDAWGGVIGDFTSTETPDIIRYWAKTLPPEYTF